MSDPVILNIIFRAKPDRAAELGARLDALSEASAREPGRIRFDVHHVEGGDLTTWLLHEVWRSDRDFAAHQATPASASLRGALTDLLREPPSALRPGMTSGRTLPDEP